MTKRKEFWEILRFILYIFGMFILFYLYFTFTDKHYSECITNNWCINSTDSPSSFAILWTVNIIILAGSIYLAKWFALWLVMKGWIIHAMIVITIGFSALGTLLYFTVVQLEDRMEFLHIPIISALMGIVGVVLIRRLFQLRN